MSKKAEKPVLTPEEKKEKLIELVKAIYALEQEIEPLQESLKELKKNYVENGWIGSDELKALMKALAIRKHGESIDQISEIYEKLIAEFGTA